MGSNLPICRATLAILPGGDTDRLTVADHTGRDVAYRTLKPST